MKGKLLWKKDLGVLDAGWFTDPDMQWEFGSSPVLHDGKVVILADVQKGSFLATFDAKTGNEIWRMPRADVPDLGHARRSTRSTARRRSSSTASNTPAPTTSRPAKRSGS